MSYTQEKIYLLHALQNTHYFALINENFFGDELLCDLFKISKKYYERFQEIPENFGKQLKVLISRSKFSEKITNEDIDAVFSEGVVEYDFRWREQSIRTWIKVKDFEERALSMSEYIRSQEITPENADNILHRATDIFNNVSINLTENDGIDFFNPESHIFLDTQRMVSGKPFVDQFLGGGYESKTLVCYLGEQGVGKSLWLCNDAAHFVKHGFNVIYISAEMSEKSVMKRIGSILFQTAIKKYESLAKQDGFIKTKIDDMLGMGIKTGKLQIKQMANPTIPEIEAFAKKQEKLWKEKVHVIIGDYFGIFSNYRNPTSDNTYTNIKYISKDYRDMCLRIDCLGLNAMQIGKGAWGKGTFDISAIAECAALAHNVDIMYAIIQDPEMLLNNEYWLKILKMRDGEGKNWKNLFKVNNKTLSLTPTTTVLQESA